MAIGPDVDFDIEHKRFANGELLLQRFRLRVEAGDTLVMVGDSGVGKSTLLRLAAGLDRSFEGHVTVAGTPAEPAQNQGVMFQDSRLLPWLTIGGNIAAAAGGGSDAALAMLDALGLKGTAALLPRQLSAGMQRRVALVRALARTPWLLLLDEPFASLDADAARTARLVLRQFIVSHRPTTIIASHDVEDALTLADRIIVLSGRPAAIVADIDGEGPDRSVLHGALMKAKDTAYA